MLEKRKQTSPIKKRSAFIQGHKTSISLEDDFWNALHEIADGQQRPISHLINHIAEGREGQNLSSAVRVYVLRHYQALAEVPQAPKSEKHSSR